MNPRLCLVLAAAFVATAAAADNKGDKKDDKVKSDLLPPDKRRAAVDLAQSITRPPAPEPLPADLAQPFNPPGFDLPDRSELPPPPAANTAAQTPRASGGDTGPAAPPAPAPGEREKLETLAAKIPATGTITLGATRLLSFGSKNVRIGADFTITYNGQDYVLKLVAVDATTFTVRLGNEEVTRPIKPGK